MAPQAFQRRGMIPMSPPLAMLGATEILIIALAVFPVALLIIAGLVTGIVILVRRSSTMERRLQSLEQSIARLHSR
jgi:cytochrome c-type biogenesis protein CcmH/NrfF